MLPSVPRAKTSSRSGPHVTADGVAVRLPPRDSQSFQMFPSHQRWHSPPSVPIANTSMRFWPQLTATGGEASEPPRFCHSLNHVDPVRLLWRSVKSAPRAKTSRRPGSNDTMLAVTLYMLSRRLHPPAHQHIHII